MTTSRTIRGSSLEILNLVKNYHDNQVVRNINLDIDPGKFLTLLGPSGSGKSTTLLMIAGFTKPTSGDILINGELINKLPPYKRDIGLVFQNYALFPHMTVADNVGFPLTMRKMSGNEKRERVEEYLKLVNLEGFGDRYPHQISGGQQQRVALARALVFNPSLVLMDEPLGALDRRLRMEMQFEIKRIQEELGLTVLYVTHDQEEALSMSDKIAVMEEGDIAFFGTPKEIYEKPSSVFVANFIGQSNLLEGVAAGQNNADRQSVVLQTGQQIEGMTTQTITDGENIILMLRPERVRICKKDDIFDNKLQGKVVEQVYLGDHMMIIVNVEDTYDVSIKRPNRGFGGEVEVGDQVYIGWQNTDSVILLNDKPNSIKNSESSRSAKFV